MTDEQMDARLRAAGAAWRASAGRPVTVAEPSAAAAAETLDVGRPHRPRRFALLASAAVVAAALVTGGAFLLGSGGGKPHQGAAAAALEGTVWRLVSAGSAPPMANSPATMYIDKHGSLVADDSCAVVSAHVDVRDGHLYPTGNFDIRDRDCTDSVGEPAFGDGFGLLTDFPSYHLTGDGLMLSAAGQPSMRFTAAAHLLPPTTDIPTFLGATWRLTQVVDGQQVQHPVTGHPTLQVKGGRLVASDGCNTINAAAAVSGQEVALKDISTSAVGCLGTAGATAAAVDAFFTTAGLHEQIQGTTLTIKGDGVGYLTYTWVPDDAPASAPSALTDKPWILTSIAGEPARALASLYIDSRGPVSGTDGCTDLDATATVGTGALTLTGAPTAPPATCTGAAHDQATTIDSFLTQEPALWAVRDGKLLIYGGGAQAFALVYDTGTPPPTFPSSTPDATQLAGHRWRFVGAGVRRNGTVSGRSAAESAILTFDGNGRYNLALRCGAYSGTVAVRGATLNFADRSFVPHSCPAIAAADERIAVRADEGALARVLAGPVSWAFDSGQLTLVKGDTTLTFDP